MSVPDYVRLARHTLDIDDDGHHGQVGDAPDPIDRAINGIAYYPIPASGTVSVVQVTPAVTEQTSMTITLTLPAAPTPGNVLVLWEAIRGVTAVTPTGWTAHPDGQVDYDGGAGVAAMYYRTVEDGEDETLVISTVAARHRMIVAEVPSSALVSSAEASGTSAAQSVSATPTTGVSSVVFGGFIHKRDDDSFTPDVNSTELDDGHVGVGFHPLSWFGYRIVASPDGSAYAVGTTTANSAVWAGQSMAFSAGGGVTWVTTDKPIDFDDATYIETVGTDALRLQLDAQYRVASARLRIACENAGSRTYELWGTNNPDYTTGLTLLGSATFTATGTFTAQDVAFSFAGTTGYRYHVLVGNDETRRIHTLELFSPVLAPVTDHGGLTGLADDDHGQYQLRSEKDAANGYPGLNAAGFVAPGKLGSGALTDGTVLTVQTDGTLAFEAGGGGYTDPLTTRGDLVVRDASATTRLPIGTTGHVLTSDGTDAVWQASASGFSNPMTTAGDIIKGGTGGAAERLAIGSAGQVLSVVSGAPAWAAGGGGSAPDPIADVFGAADTAFEFDTSSLTGLTAIGTADAEDADTTIPGHYYVAKAATASVALTGRYAAATPPFTAIIKVSGSSVMAANFSRVGHMFIGEATPGGVETVALVHSNNWQVTHQDFSSPTAFTANIGTDMSTKTVAFPLYYGIVVNSSTDIDFWYSYDGMIWRKRTDARNPGFTVASVGMVVDPENATLGVAAAFDFLRIWNSVKTMPGI